MKNITLIVVSLFLVLNSGCANIASWRPHGHTDYRAADLTTWDNNKASATKSGSSRVLVVGQVNDQSIPPLGALYQDDGFAESPLVEVYHLAKPGQLIADALPKQFNAAGLRAYRDASDLGDAVNGEGVFPKGLLVLRLDLTSLTYARHVEGFDALLADYEVHVYSADTNEKLYSLKSSFKIKLDWNIEAMVLPLDGFEVMAKALVDELVRDEGFLNQMRGS
jgi:hypothetical protein